MSLSLSLCLSLSHSLSLSLSLSIALSICNVVVDLVIINTGSVCTKTRVSAILCLRIGWMETCHLIVKIRGSMTVHIAFDTIKTDRSGISAALGIIVTFAKRPLVCRSQTFNKCITSMHRHDKSTHNSR